MILPFTNEFFTPNYSGYFFNLDVEIKKEFLLKQNFWSDTIESSLLEGIYRKLYEIELINGNEKFCSL